MNYNHNFFVQTFNINFNISKFLYFILYIVH
jgi:hypothetical protein